MLLLPTAAPVNAVQRTEVAIKTASYAPAVVTLAAPGDRVHWVNVTAPSRVHDVVSSLPDYFHSALGGSGMTFTVTFSAAGSFSYFCSIHDTMLGAVWVPLAGRAVADAAGTHFRLVLGSTAWPAGSRYVSVVRVQAPGDAAPRYWRTTRRPTIDFTPSAPGSYSFVVRVKDSQTGRQSGDSAPLTISFGG